MDLASFGDQHAVVYSLVSYPFLLRGGAGPESSHFTAAKSCIKSIGWICVVLESTLRAK